MTVGETRHPTPRATVTRTRQAIGSQLREAFDAMVEAGQIEAYESHYGRTGPGEPSKAYTVHDSYGRTDQLSPGEAMDFVNAYGYDVRFGKA